MYYTMENFIDYCEEYQIAEEGLFNKIKEKFSKKKSENVKSVPKNVQSTMIKASSSNFKHLYDTEAMCAEGLKDPDSEETKKLFTDMVSKWEGCPEKVNFYYCSGKDLNNYYHLTGDNRYPNDLGIFFIDTSNFGKEFDASSHKGKFRWFSDVVDNNARREIQKGNKYYDGYHSLYGDEWFYSTI